MRLSIGCKMTLQAAAECPTVAMLRPRSGEAQWLVSESYDFEPRVRITEYVDAYGNLCQRFVIPQGEMSIRITAEVETEDEIVVDFNAPATKIASLPNDTLQYLLQSRYCPSDKPEAEAKASQIVGKLAPGYAQVEAIRSWIHTNIVYRYGVSTLSTDALDTLTAGAGVCRDFSHIGITLCRSLGIPARMVVGYLYRLDPMDLHAWFEAFIDGRWYTFDATQDQARGGRVVVAYGHDAADVAFISNYAALETTALEVTVELAPAQ